MAKFTQENEIPKECVNMHDITRQQSTMQNDQDNKVDFTKRAQWLRAALLGANDGLLSTSSLMMGVGAARRDPKTMILAGISGLVAGATSMAIGEFVSVYSQRDIEIADMKRKNCDQNESTGMISLSNPFQAAGASAVAFAVGAVVPLLPAALIGSTMLGLGVVVGVSSLALLGFGGLGAYLGRAPYIKSCLRVLIGGWVAMAITFGMTKSFVHLLY